MSKKIFIVDDDPDMVKALQFRLESRGYEVEACENGAKALDAILESDFGIVLMDYFMPGLKGDQICQSIRQEDRLKELPILILTAFSHYDENFFKGQGATEVLYKPVNLDELLEKINKYLPSD